VVETAARDDAKVGAANDNDDDDDDDDDDEAVVEVALPAGGSCRRFASDE